MTKNHRYHLASFWMLYVLTACSGQLIAGNPDGGGTPIADGGGGQMGACAPGAAPTTPEQEVLDKEQDGQECVVPSCAEMDPDQMGELGGINAIGWDEREAQLGEFGNGCESKDLTKPPSCTPHPHGIHRGGNQRHDVCSDIYGPYRNDYYVTTDPPGEGKDAVVNGYCLDGIHIEMQNGVPVLYYFWEMKTARYGVSRLTGRPVCLFYRRKILANVFASILKEYPAVRACGDKYRYQVAIADSALYSAFNKLRERAFAMPGNEGQAFLHLKSWNLIPVADDFKTKRAVTIDSLLTDDLHISTANLNAARTIVVEYLLGPPPVYAKEAYLSQACDAWKKPSK